MKNPLVSIVVLSHNRWDEIKDCLESLKKTKYPNFEVIVVDNHSTDGTLEKIKKRFKWAKVVENDKNLGPVKGRLIGVKASKGSFIAFFDNDVVVTPNWLSEVMKTFNKDKTIGSCAIKTMLHSNKKLVNSAGMGCDIFGFAYSRGLIARGVYEEDNGQYDKEEEVFGSYATAMVIKKDVFKKVASFDPAFVMYYEEIDLSWRVRLAGYKVVYVPTSVVFHKFSATKTDYFTKDIFHSKVVYFTEKNRFRSMIQNYGLGMLFRVLPFYIPLKFLECLLYISFGKITTAAMLGKGILSTVIELPKIIRKRSYMQRKVRRVRDSEVTKLMDKRSLEVSRFLRGYGKFVLRKTL